MGESLSNRVDRPASNTASIDQAIACCANIATVAGLLKSQGAPDECSALGDDLITDAGRMIGEETQKLRQLLRELAKPR